MNKIIEQNRNVCENINWISEDIWESSGDFYGLPRKCYNEINNRLSNDLSYTDIIVFLIRKYELKNYLEIGVSVLKNIYQVAHNTTTNIIAFDINIKNPCVKLPRPLKYIKGNVMIKEDWEPLKALNKNHSIIFSDALHTNEGLNAEWEYYIKDHLANNFIIIWDDAYTAPLNHIKNKFIPQLERKYGKIYTKLISVQEWIPNVYHPIFIVSNFSFVIE